MKLPQSFLDNMKELLGEEYDAWLTAMEEHPHQGLRINRLKLDRETWERIRPWEGDPVPWTTNGYYYEECERPARDPYYFAGLYYLQEPSAMAPAAVLPVEPGDKVLDLCAAPGGKSTELGTRLHVPGGLSARMEQGGLLVSNDISASRARALLKNLELFGIANLCVTTETPQRLEEVFGAYFDKILVDAPCSGEGMFRKDAELIKSWSGRGPEEYAPIQREILRSAAHMLRPGGALLYSTCTFSPIEDEENVRWLLETEPDMELCEIPLWEGACRGIDGSPVIRLFPHHVRGEGHFLALLRKKDAMGNASAEGSGEHVCAKKSGEHVCAKESGEQAVDPQLGRLEKESDFLQWEKLLTTPLLRERIMIRDQQVYYLPAEFDRHRRLRYLRTGLLLGEWKKQRFEPSQAAAMALQAGEFRQVFSMKREDERVIRYLKGETIFPEEGEKLPKGWILVCVDGFPLGWAKYTGTMLKNKYYAGWRWQ